jgi:hypothetical protein
MQAPAAPRTRLSLLVDQYDTSHEFFRNRLAGLTDEEYRWEPVPGCWSVRPRAEATTSRARGKGAWVLDFEHPEPTPAPLTTIAWRLCHIVASQMQRHDWTFGTKSLRTTDIEFPGTAAEALVCLDRSRQAWRAGLGRLADPQLDTVGLSSFPGGWDPNVPFGDILWWTNRELIHHGAEIAVLRDLWRHTGGRRLG